MTCLIRPQILSSFDRRSFLSICSSRAFNITLMSDQRASGFCVFNPADSLCVSTISSSKTHSRGRPGFLFCFINTRSPSILQTIRDREREYKNRMVSKTMACISICCSCVLQTRLQLVQKLSSNLVKLGYRVHF